MPALHLCSRARKDSRNSSGLIYDEKRTARFVCVVHFIYPDGKEVAARGVCEGIIGREPLGENGFGYDPIFMYGEKSFAQLSQEEKSAVSHRGNALRDLLEKLSENK